MSWMTSPIDELNGLKLEPLPAKPLRDATVVRHDRCIVAITKDGKVYTNRVNANCCYVDGVGLDDVVRALVKARALSAKAAGEHLALREKKEAARQKRYAAKDLKEAAKTLGVRLTKAQQAAIDAVLPQRAEGS